MNELHCICLPWKATLKYAVYCSSATLIWRRRTASNCPPYYYYYRFQEAKLYLRKFILLLSFRQITPLHMSTYNGHLEACRLLLQCNADLEAKDHESLPPLFIIYYCCFYEAKLCLRKLILYLFFNESTPLHWSAFYGHLEVCRLLVESKADVTARERCFSPPPSHHLSLTICPAAGATLHSNVPSSATKPTSLHTCAASARRNDALSRST